MVATPTSIVYPDSDGLPMSDNTRQFEYIVYEAEAEVDRLKAQLRAMGHNPDDLIGTEGRE